MQAKATITINDKKGDSHNAQQKRDNNTREENGRRFDLDMRYGPFVGIDRETRWKRAIRFGQLTTKRTKTGQRAMQTPNFKKCRGRTLW